jgi:hypothetical protein
VFGNAGAGAAGRSAAGRRAHSVYFPMKELGVSVPDLCAYGRFAMASTSGLSLTSRVRLKADATSF